MIASEIAKSKIEPRFGTEAGDKFTVTRRPGNGKPELWAAARTRSRASESDASGNPTRTNAGKLLEISASISMIVPAKPTRLTE
jgi:hypothetical protein